MTISQSPLEIFLEETLMGPLQPEAAAMARHLASRFGPEAEAVLYYGSCLRTGAIDGLIMDFYVLVGDYARAYGHGWLAFLNRLLPPNVFYAELPWRGKTLRAKAAVMTTGDFRKRCSPKRFNSSLWARFSQPSRLAWFKSAAAGETVVAGVRDAVSAMAGNVFPFFGKNPSAQKLWINALRLTYGAEFRSERADKAEELCSLNRVYFENLTPLALAALERAKLGTAAQAERRWRRRRFLGKGLSLLRLLKAGVTFSGGMDYLAWKVERSSGVKVALKPWQRRYPVVAAPLLFFRLRRKGVFR